MGYRDLSKDRAIKWTGKYYSTVRVITGMHCTQEVTQRKIEKNDCERSRGKWI